MGLKADRIESATDISFFMNQTSERGVIVVHENSGSGSAMDQSEATVAVPTGGVSGTRPAGLLLCDVVEYDLTKQPLNWHKDEVQKGSKVTILRRGWVVTDKVDGDPSAGDPAWYDTQGRVRPTDPGDSTKVGNFLSGKDADGYAKVEINITG